jgi:hypothetical protein
MTMLRNLSLMNAARAGSGQMVGGSGIRLWCLDFGEDNISILSRI